MCSAQGTKLRRIRAAICRANGRLDLTDVDIEPPRENELLVRMVATGICRTDIDFCADEDGAILGHEGAGVVEQVGTSVRDLRPGDHVLMSYNSCGRCEACQKQQPANCENFMPLNFGLARQDGTSAYRGNGVQGHFFGQSSFASHTIVNVRNVVRVNQELALEILAPLGCGLQTGAGTVINSLAIERDCGIIILGAGSVGLAAVMAAKVKEAGNVVVVDKRPERLELALALGATEVIDSSSERGSEQLAEVGGSGFASEGFDYAIDSTGDSVLIKRALAQLKPSGRMALLTGGGVDDRRAFGVIQGNAVPQTFIPYLIRLWQNGDFPIEHLVSHYAFSEINQAFADLREGRAIKPVLKFG
ncbi:MAG: Zn-dependent alcohol dehydrogenase, class III [Marinobacter sp. T13-3]|nr:MAG: Zn-dependent alcohol dehydrogenase, class III [Marinobacter sp. T13-3]